MMHDCWRVAIGLALAVTVTLGQPVGRANQSDVVYVESNRADGNSILAYRNDGSGNLAPLSGSPFPTGGTGVFDLSLQLGPFDSDQNVIVDSDDALLFAVNSGSNTIAVFTIGSDGRLRSAPGSPFPSGGINPVSVGLKDDILVVVNKDQDPNQGANPALPNYVTLRVRHNGELTPAQGPIVPVAYGTSPSQAAISAVDRLVFGADFLGGLLQSFRLSRDGGLSQNPPQALPDSEFADLDVPHLPLGLHTHPESRILYVGFVTANKLGVYRYDEDGELQFVRTVPNSGVAICWVITNRRGTRLYTSNTGDNSISVYDISQPARPVEIQYLVMSGLGNAFQIVLDRSEEFLYAVTQRGSDSIPLGQGNTLHVLQVHHADGTLTELSVTDLSLPDGTRPQGVAVF